MANSKDIADSELRLLAEQFAKDFEFSFDKIVIKKNGFVSYRTNSDGTGGWKEGTPATVIPAFVIRKHYELIAAECQAAEIKARLVELDLLEQQINRWELPAPVYKELNRFKLLRLKNLTDRLDALRNARSSE